MKLRINARSLVIASITCIAIAGTWVRADFTGSNSARAQGNDSRYFPETKHTVTGIFWKYWQEHGGLAQQGYPISRRIQ